VFTGPVPRSDPHPTLFFPLLMRCLHFRIFFILGSCLFSAFPTRITWSRKRALRKFSTTKFSPPLSTCGMAWLPVPFSENSWHRCGFFGKPFFLVSPPTTIVFSRVFPPSLLSFSMALCLTFFGLLSLPQIFVPFRVPRRVLPPFRSGKHSRAE